MSATNWVIDNTHSEIGFKIRHMMVTNVSGKFDQFEGKAISNEDDFSNAQIDFQAQISSVNTGNADRDGHLKSPDFFDAEQFPTLTFKSTSFEKKSSDTYQLNGELTLHGFTKPVSLTAELGGINKDPWGNTKAGFSLNGKINRKDFGLNWNAALETGGVLVSEDVKLQMEVQLLKQ